MPPKEVIKSNGGVGVAAAAPPSVAVSPPSGHESEQAGSKRPALPPALDASPKKMVRNIVNITLEEWMQRCPEGSPPGSTGSGNSYAVILDMGPCTTVVTKKDQRRVAKKTIVIGDCSGKEAELTIWGNFAARSWTFPEGSVLLFRNLTFASYYKDKLQLKFADPDAAHELLITKAPESLAITQSLKKWFVNRCFLFQFVFGLTVTLGTVAVKFARRFQSKKLRKSPETIWYLPVQLSACKI